MINWLLAVNSLAQEPVAETPLQGFRKSPGSARVIATT
jgi:hypothetical protein